VAGAARVRRAAKAGATWWIESDWMTSSVARRHERIEAGPPVG
jgi:hypothetical protein